MFETSRCRSRSSSKIRPICPLRRRLSGVRCHWPFARTNKAKPRRRSACCSSFVAAGLRDVQQGKRHLSACRLQYGLEHLDITQMDQSQGSDLRIRSVLTGLHRSHAKEWDPNRCKRYAIALSLSRRRAARARGTETEQENRRRRALTPDWGRATAASGPPRRRLKVFSTGGGTCRLASAPAPSPRAGAAVFRARRMFETKVSSAQRRDNSKAAHGASDSNRHRNGSLDRANAPC